MHHHLSAQAKRSNDDQQYLDAFWGGIASSSNNGSVARGRFGADRLAALEDTFGQALKDHAQPRGSANDGGVVVVVCGSVFLVEEALDCVEQAANMQGQKLN